MPMCAVCIFILFFCQPHPPPTIPALALYPHLAPTRTLNDVDTPGLIDLSFVLRRNAIDMDGNLTPPTAGTGGEGAHERGTLKDRIVRAREQLDDLVEQTAGQFRKITVSHAEWGYPIAIEVLMQSRKKVVVFLHVYDQRDFAQRPQ